MQLSAPGKYEDFGCPTRFAHCLNLDLCFLSTQTLQHLLRSCCLAPVAQRWRMNLQLSRCQALESEPEFNNVRLCWLPNAGCHLLLIVEEDGQNPRRLPCGYFTADARSSATALSRQETMSLSGEILKGMFGGDLQIWVCLVFGTFVSVTTNFSSHTAPQRRVWQFTRFLCDTRQQLLSDGSFQGVLVIRVDRRLLSPSFRTTTEASVSSPR